MKCGQFVKNAKDKITIQEQVLTGDDYGSSTNTWTNVAVPWAWVMPLSTFERVSSEQLRGTTTHKMYIRYDSTLANVKVVSSYRILLDSRIHNVKGIKLLDATGKNYGKTYIELRTEENETELS